MSDHTIPATARASFLSLATGRLIACLRASRYARAASSLAIVVVAYWAYVLLVVPWIEPAADPRSAASEVFGPNAIASETEEFSAWFPPGSWQLQNPKILENGPARLLFQDYSNLGEGRVKIHPCSIIYLSNGPAADEAERKRQAVILDAPEGGVLQFDRPLDLRKAEIGRVTAGQLQGCITIRSEGRLAGPEDDLRIITQDLQMTERQLWTNAAVDFRFGPNFGRGSQMTIRFASAQPGAAANNLAPNIGGLDSFELRQVERLHLEPGSNKPKDALQSPQAQAPAAANKPPGAASFSAMDGNQLPVEVTCRGPLRFEMGAKTATLYDQVNVLRIHPEGPTDQLLCDSLLVHFRPKAGRRAAPPVTASSAAEQAKAAAILDLEPARLEARGEPVVVLAPAQQVEARGRRLDYDLISGKIVLEGEQARISQGPNEIYAPALQYQPDPSGRMGRMEAKGPGWLQGQMADRPQQRLQARWNRLLRVRPDDQGQVISLTGGAELNFPEMGRLESQEIHFWMHEIPAAGKSARFQPDRLWADGEVHVGSAQLSAVVDHLEVWFEAMADAGQPAAPRGASPPSAQQVPPGRLQPTALREPAAGAAAATAAGPTSPLQHFEVVGKVLRTRVRTLGQQTEVAELIVEDNVRFRETQTARPDEQPVEITGDWIRAVDASSPRGTITVVGRPAQFRGRGLGLKGANINLNRGSNRLWVEGAGTMDVPMDRTLDGQPISGGGGRLDIRWQGGMNFDGRMASFQDTVSAVAAQGHLDTDILEVLFREFIRFEEAAGQQQPQVEQVVCRSGVSMEGVTLEGQEQVSVQRAQFSELRINAQSGQMVASGPGWITRVGRGSSRMFAGQMPLGPAGRAAPEPVDDNALTCLHVRFQGPATGNIFRRQVDLYERVQMAYGPAQDWYTTLDPTRPELLGPRGATMVCDRLSIVEMPAAGERRQAIELEALGNTIVESQAYTARAARIAYAEAKGLLILEGDGRSDARLFQQNSGGRLDSDLAAKRIWFWPATNDVQIDGPRSVQIDRFPLGAGKNPGGPTPPKL